MKYQGRLQYNDHAQYILVQDDGVEVNISKILDEIYHAPTNTLDFELVKGTRLLHEESGLLIRKKNQNGFYSYHINSLLDLDLVLFNQVGERIEITLSRGDTDDEKRQN